MARWNRAHGRCGDRRKKGERRAISRTENGKRKTIHPSVALRHLPCLRGGKDGRGLKNKQEKDMSLDVLLTSAVLCIALVLIWASLKDE